MAAKIRGRAASGGGKIVVKAGPTLRQLLLSHKGDGHRPAPLTESFFQHNLNLQRRARLPARDEARE